MNELTKRFLIVDMELIDKSKLLEGLKKLKQNLSASPIVVIEDVESLVESLEVKEVDLDFQTFAKEMDAVFDLPSTETTNTEEDPLNWEYAIAKHYFKLGLKAKEDKE